MMYLLTGGEALDEVGGWGATDVAFGFDSAQNQPIFEIE